MCTKCGRKMKFITRVVDQLNHYWMCEHDLTLVVVAKDASGNDVIYEID